MLDAKTQRNKDLLVLTGANLMMSSVLEEYHLKWYKLRECTQFDALSHSRADVKWTNFIALWLPLNQLVLVLLFQLLRWKLAVFSSFLPMIFPFIPLPLISVLSKSCKLQSKLLESISYRASYTYERSTSCFSITTTPRCTFISSLLSSEEQVCWVFLFVFCCSVLAITYCTRVLVSAGVLKSCLKGQRCFWTITIGVVGHC